MIDCHTTCLRSTTLHGLDVSVVRLDPDAFEVVVEATTNIVYMRVEPPTATAAEAKYELVVRTLERSVVLSGQQMHRLGLNAEQAIWRFGDRHFVPLTTFPPQERLMMKLRYG